MDTCPNTPPASTAHHHHRVAAALVLACSLATATLVQAGPPPQKLDTKNLPGEVVNQIVIPIPQEIFLSLNKLGARDWQAAIRKGQVRAHGVREQDALLLGVIIANGFVAVAAEDANEVERTGRQILKLADSLGLKEPIIKHTKAIIDSSRRGDWRGVRLEFDQVQDTVRGAMRDMRDDDIAELVSVGGWIGGTQVVAAMLTKKYDADASEILNQPELLAQISSRFAVLPEKMRHDQMLAGVEAALGELVPHVQGDSSMDGAVPRRSIDQIHAITSRLVDGIYRLKPMP